MKHMKKLASVLLAMVMVFGLATTAFAAAEGELTGGSITITNPVESQTYNAYQILYLESYNAESGAYAYKANSAWEAWLKAQTTYVTVDAQGYVTWVEGADVAAFAKAAQGQLAGKTADGSVTATADNVAVTIDGLKLGYYIVDSTIGSLCSLNTIKPNVKITDKNEKPTVDKEVQEDSNNQWGDKDDADISQTVNFQSTITAQAGAKNYVFHDKMSAGLTYGSVTGVTLNGTAVAAANYTVVTTGITDGCTFHVEFTQAFCDTLKANDKIVISYTATLNENAVIAGEGNPNEAWLEYGENSETTHDTTKTYTWEFKVFKHTGTGDNKEALAGAEFVLYKTVNGANHYAQVTNGKITGWTTNKAEATTLVSGADGKINITGLDSDTYYLEETKAPAGYNKLSGPVTVIIDNEGNVKDSAAEGALALADKTVNVENKTGTELPSTGGIGTTIFYVVGGILVVGAAVLLITRKRMGEQ